MLLNTCCFLGHRRITETAELREVLTNTIENLITIKNVNTFLFGSKSHFDKLCLELVSALKHKHPHIKRVYVRAEYPIINEDYESYLLKYYDETYYPPDILGAGKAVYIKRNYEMIDKSQFCIVHYIEDSYKSGTKIALSYAIKRNKEIYYV